MRLDRNYQQVIQSLRVSPYRRNLLSALILSILKPTGDDYHELFKTCSNRSYADICACRV
jgi:hypothetical protein